LLIVAAIREALDYGTGGPKQIEQLYTRDMLERAFGDLDDVVIVEEERELNEGAGAFRNVGVYRMTGRKP